MPDGPKSIWLAAHLYYNEPWEVFITKAIEPYIRTVMRTGIAKQYFFLRYWERGPHIRLRFRGDATVLEQLLQPNLEEHFYNYFDAKPSERTEPNYPPDLPRDYLWLPNNSVQWIDYEPESNRYGGAIGVKIAERQFQASSDIVLQYIRQKGLKWSYDDALGTAIKLHLSFAHTLGLNMEDITRFFGMIFFNWLPRALQMRPVKGDNEKYRLKIQETLQAFGQSFEMQKGALLPFHQQLWEALETDEGFEEDILNTWITSNAVVRLQYETALTNGQLAARQQRYHLPDDLRADLPADQELLWNIYADFVHMTNNRLGILNKDEGYLGYLIMESMQTLRSSGSRRPINYLSDQIDRAIIDELL